MKVQSTQPVLKQRLWLWILPAFLSIGLFSASVSQGQIVGGYTNVYWSGTNLWTSGNAALGGAGSWNSSSNYWTTNALGATGNSNGPIGGGTFIMVRGPANTATNNNSGGFIVNFSGTPGQVQLSSIMEVNQVRFLVNGYTFLSQGARQLTSTNSIDLANNVNTIITTTAGNSFTFTGPGLSGGTGSSLTLGAGVTSGSANYVSSVWFNGGGTISVPITMNVGGASNAYAAKFILGTQSSTGGGLTINGNITNNSAGPLDLSNSASGNLVINGVISGSRGITLGNSSSGKIILTAANTYSGGTTLLSTGTGEITYSNAAAFGSGPITASGSGTTNYIRALATDLDLANNIAIDANSTLRVGATNTGWKANYSGVISGPGSVLYSLSGFMGLSGTNSSFGGGFVLGSSGRADLSKIGMAGENSSIGTNGVIAAGTITTPSSKPTLRWVGTTNDTSDKVINIGNASGGLELQTLGNGNLMLNGNINSSGLGGPKTIFIIPYTNSSAGTTNTLSLNGVINDGTPGYVVNDATIAASATTITLSSVAGVANGALISGGGCIASGTTIIAVNTTTKVITLSQATTNTANISAGLAVMNVEGATAATALVIQPKSSAGSTFVNVVLGNTANSFSGGVLFTNSQSGLNSILKISKFGNSGENSSLGTASSMTFGGASGSTSTLDYTGNGEVSSKTITLGGSTGTVGLSQSGLGLLKLTGSILPGSTAGSRRLVLSGSSSGTGELASDLGNLSTFTLSIAKSGSGTWTLSGANNTYTGATDIQNGILIVDATSALPTASAITVSNGATLRFLKSSGGINVGAMTVAGNLEQNLITITSSGAVNLAGSTLKVNGMPTSVSYTLINGNPVTGNPTYSGPTGYELSVEPTSVKLVKTVVVTGSTFDNTYPLGSEEAVGPNGLKNLMNYALGGTGPTSSPALPVLTSDANGLTLTANIRNDDNSGLTVDGEYAESLEGPWTKVKQDEWNPDANSSVPTLTVKSFTRAFGSQPRQFLRLRATKQ